MKIKMCCSRRTPEGRLRYGTVYDVPESIGIELVNEGSAELIANDSAPGVPMELNTPEEVTDSTTSEGPLTLEDAGFSGKSLHLLQEAGILTVEQVRNHPDLEAIPGIGKALKTSILAMVKDVDHMVKDVDQAA